MNKIIKEQFKNFIGTNYEIGVQIGKWVEQNPELLKKSILPRNTFPKNKLDKIIQMIDTYCDGVNEEIKGFSDYLNISTEQVIFYAMTYLERGCSLFAISKNQTQEKKTYLARNYDFNDELEEMCFSYTEVKGKYKYIGANLNLFGRCDGMNEHGLAIGMASNGFPVGNFEGGIKPNLDGLSFWLIIRSILENCKTVQEAIETVKVMPVAFNLSLVLADRNDTIGLLQSIDGIIEYQEVESESEQNCLACTNHSVLPNLKKRQKNHIENSEIRYNNINYFLQKKEISKQDIKGILSTAYPNGLCCHFYQEYFGTLRSMIFNTTDKNILISFGSPQVNKWIEFSVEPLAIDTTDIILPQKKLPNDFYKLTT